MVKNAQELIHRLRSYKNVDIGEARALPMDMYTSEELLGLETEQIFRREWICVGRLEQVPNVGDYFTLEILGEPILIARGEDDRLRALSNVCRHRYFSVAEGSGNTQQFTCRYHKWTYKLDGELRAAPYMGGVKDIHGNRCRLPELPLETWLGFIFISLNRDARPLAPRLVGAAEILRNYDMETWRVAPAVDEVWPGNWKLALETALEGYHVDGLHPTTVADLMPSKSSTFEATSEQWTGFRMDTVYSGSFAEYAPFAQMMDGRDVSSAPELGIFPNCAVSCSQFTSVWLTFLPIDVGHTRVIGANLVHPLLYEQLSQSEEALAMNEAAINQINAEDASAMINLQRNAHARHAEPGLLCDKERCLLFFYRYLARMMGEPRQIRQEESHASR